MQAVYIFVPDYHLLEILHWPIREGIRSFHERFFLSSDYFFFYGVSLQLTMTSVEGDMNRKFYIIIPVCGQTATKTKNLLYLKDILLFDDKNERTYCILHFSRICS